MYQYIEVEEGFQLEGDASHDGGLGVCPECHEPLESDEPLVNRAGFFKKADGWTRRLMDDMCRIFNGSTI